MHRVGTPSIGPRIAAHAATPDGDADDRASKGCAGVLVSGAATDARGRRRAHVSADSRKDPHAGTARVQQVSLVDASAACMVGVPRPGVLD
jgi:hypothetical protein